jgi:hypothetical protein
VEFNILKGLADTEVVRLNTSKIRKACARVETKVLNREFAAIENDMEAFPLVICSNVIDQSKNPLALVELLKRSTELKGYLLLSCTYQWQDKYVGNAAPRIKDINELFGAGWKKCGETNIPFQVRVNERHWMTFLSHVTVQQKTV